MFIVTKTNENFMAGCGLTAETGFLFSLAVDTHRQKFWLPLPDDPDIMNIHYESVFVTNEIVLFRFGGAFDDKNDFFGHGWYAAG